MLVYFCRHGQTDASNADGIIQGHLDTRLNAQGRAEARALAGRLESVSFAEAWSSPLSRAYETAEIVVAAHDDLELRADAGLKERMLGSLEGRRRGRGEPVPADAEDGKAFAARVTAWLAAFLDAHAPAAAPAGPAAHDAPILVLSHGAYLSALLRVLLAPPVALAVDTAADLRRACYNTSVMRVRFEYAGRGRPGWRGWTGVVESWGDVAHLEGMDDPDALKDVADDLAR